MADVGLREVAARAKVSVATVSNVLNRPERVTARTIDRVMKVVEELGYVPNVAARQLKSGRSNVLGMAVLNITNPFFAQVVLGAEEIAEKAGYSVIVGNSYDSPSRESRYLELFEQQRLDGVLLAPVSDDLSGLDPFARRGVPVVLVDRVDPRGLFVSVSVDDVRGGQLATEHIVATGARHIAFVGGPWSVAQMRDRLEGCRQVAHARAVRLSEYQTGPLNARIGREIGDQIAQMPAEERPDGIFAANDEAALGILQSLVMHSIAVPKEIVIVGFDDIDLAASAIVPLTSVSQPANMMGVRAAELLLAGILAPDQARASVRFEPELVARQSTRRG